MGMGRLFQVERVERPSKQRESMSQGSEEKCMCYVRNGEPLHDRTVAGGGPNRWVGSPCRGSCALCWDARRLYYRFVLTIEEVDRLLNLAGLFL